MPDHSSLDPATDRIIVKLIVLGLVPAVIVGGLASRIDLVGGLIALVAVQVVWTLVVIIRTRGVVGQVLRSLDARPMKPGEYPQVENLLQGLSLTGGVRVPDVRILDTPAMNALLVADQDEAVMVVTSGLVGGLDRIELEGVLANLLARRRDGSARYATTVTAMYGNTSAAGGARLLLSGLGEQRGVRSDLSAVDMTLYPPGLASALEKMDRVGTHVPSAPVETWHLWLAPVLSIDKAKGSLDEGLVDSTIQPLDLRVAVLGEL